ncbi:MAG TPA: hypothetical protein DCW88_04845 [Agrobacterium sp.]|uniref:hypothetical protein n=1 Tax=Agrobacterium pusense TaxID=648995 RepID=UPI000E9F17C0|nr:hypothetical protein [Agrobacterium sp.]
MSALDWVRKNAKQFDQYELEVEGKKFVATWYSFNGRVPNKMVFDLKRELASLVVTETENEVLRVGGQYRSEFNKCTYTRAVYTEAVAA